MSRRLLLASVLMLSSFASAEVTLPKILSDHMVIQRDLPVHVWGRANPGEQVSVTFRDENEHNHNESPGPLERLSQARAPRAVLSR